MQTSVVLTDSQTTEASLSILPSWEVVLHAPTGDEVLPLSAACVLNNQWVFLFSRPFWELPVGTPEVQLPALGAELALFPPMVPLKKVGIGFQGFASDEWNRVNVASSPPSSSKPPTDYFNSPVSNPEDPCSDTSSVSEMSLESFHSSQAEEAALESCSDVEE